MSITFNIPLCHKHQLPFEYLCMRNQCANCFRHCSKCSKQHQRDGKLAEYRINDYIQMIKVTSQQKSQFISHLSQDRLTINPIKKDLDPKTFDVLKVTLENQKIALFNSFSDFQSMFKIKFGKHNELENSKVQKYFFNLKKYNLVPIVICTTNQNGFTKLKSQIKKITEMQRQFQQLTNYYAKYISKYQSVIQTLSNPNLQSTTLTLTLSKFYQIWRNRNYKNRSFKVITNIPKNPAITNINKNPSQPYIKYQNDKSPKKRAISRDAIKLGS